MTTKEKILKAATQLFAKDGMEGIHMRILAKASGIAPSVLYHHFQDKDTLLEEMTQTITKELDQERMLIPQPRTASAMLKDRIEFHFDHADEMVVLFKYFLAYRDKMRKTINGWLPESMYTHLVEAIQFGLKTEEFSARDINKEAKTMFFVMTGYLLEMYPKVPTGKEKETLVREIHSIVIEMVKKQTSKPAPSKSKRKR